MLVPLICNILGIFAAKLETKTDISHICSSFVKSVVQYRQISAVQNSALHMSTVQYRIVQYSAVQHNLVQCIGQYFATLIISTG